VDRNGWAVWKTVRALPLPMRGAAIGALFLGALGGMVGLVVGLLAYPPTAWAATVEVGFPGALAGALLGLIVGSLIHVVHQVQHR
jgi:hypothetical protein